MKLKIEQNPTYPELADRGADWLLALDSLAVEIGPEDRYVAVNAIAPDEMAELNRTWRGKEGATDVLSFAYGAMPGEDLDPEEDLEGEILLSVETARSQAAKQHRSVEEELSVLIVHGLHHILGYDHEEDEQARMMEKAEEPFRRRLSDWFASRS